jgi:hypothetical protein
VARVTAYYVLHQTGPHSPGEIVSDENIPDPGGWYAMNRSTVIGRLIGLGAIRVATTDEVAHASEVVPLAISNPFKSETGDFPDTFSHAGSPTVVEAEDLPD